MNREHILIVDDSHEMLEVLRRQLGDCGFSTFQATNVVDALDILKSSRPQLLITDLQMPGINGMRLVEYASEHFPQLPILVITGYPSVENALTAIQSGALDYLAKPFTKSELESAVDKLLANQRSAKQAESVIKGTTNDSEVLFHGMIGKSEGIEKTKELIKRINDTKVTVLISGESGTGKELVARAIHYSGKFAKSPFVAVNCGGIPENLLESELFGYTKGAFTGADSSRAGFFQAADGGTIFLDEIGNASLSVQQRLLRVLQEKEVTMIGAQKAQKIDVRIIAASNADLLELTKTDNFREDLYYRLNVVNIEIPALRDRIADIPLLTNYFIEKYSREFQTKKRGISDKALKVLSRYNWPGNIRELENTIQRALIMSDNAIGVEHLPEHLKVSAPKDVSSKTGLESLAEMEKRHIQKVLQSVDNNKTKAAEILGINRKTLRQKLLE